MILFKNRENSYLLGMYTKVAIQIKASDYKNKLRTIVTSKRIREISNKEQMGQSSSESLAMFYFLVWVMVT